MCWVWHWGLGVPWGKTGSSLPSLCLDSASAAQGCLDLICVDSILVLYLKFLGS